VSAAIAGRDPHALAVMRLAGIPSRRQREAPGIPESETGALCARIDAARRQARLSANEFLRLDRPELLAFCRRYGFTRAEVRLAQALAQVVRAMCRTQALARCVARQRKPAGAALQ
jgi:hypothetical protein